MNGNRDALPFDGMADAEVERRMKVCAFPNYNIPQQTVLKSIFSHFQLNKILTVPETHITVNNQDISVP